MIKIIKHHILLILIGILVFACQKNSEKIHDDAFIVDTHNDVLLRSMIGDDILNLLPESHSDLIKLKASGMDCQIFSIWVSPFEFNHEEYFNRANDMISQLEYLCSRVPNDWAIPLNYQDLIYNEQKNILSCMIGVEGGHAIENDILKLDSLYKRGMRYLGITWNNSNDWATSAEDESNNLESLDFIGLTEFGKKVIKRCNQLGIMIDVSHAGEKTFWDIIDNTDSPIIASHSSVYNLCPHFRNLKDDQLIAIKKNNGAVFVNFYPGYIDSTYSKKYNLIKTQLQFSLDSLAKIYNPDSDRYWYKENELLNPYLAEIVPDIEKVIDHIEYIVDLIGIDHVGIGADWDGVEIMPKGIESIDKLKNLTESLLKRDFSKQDIEKILGGNFKRVFKEVSR